MYKAGSRDPDEPDDWPSLSRRGNRMPALEIRQTQFELRTLEGPKELQSERLNDVQIP